jgi:hypothetical protein
MDVDNLFGVFDEAAPASAGIEDRQRERKRKKERE